MVKEHARAAMHLRDDHALGAVDHEGAVIGHQRHVAHVNGLLFNISDRLGTGILVQIPHDQTENHLQRGGIGHAALNALLNVVFRLFQLVMHELQAAAASKIVNREHRFEHFLNTRMRPRIRLHMHLQEAVIARALHINQVWHGCHFRDSPKALTNALPAGERPFTQTTSNRVHRTHPRF